MAVALAIYGGWLAATLFHGQLIWPVRVAIGGWLLAWHGSLQHEVIHGHPTPWRRVNTLIGAVPLSLWLPFERYRRSHLAHHATERVTEPGADPESRYVAPAQGPLGALALGAAHLQATLLGRMLLGPLCDVVRFIGGEVSAFARTPRDSLSLWGGHFVGLVPVVAWLQWVCHMNLIDYGLTFLFPGAAMTLIRSYAEHRPDPVPARRVAVVERAPVLGLLFLNNNLHAVHHARPAAPWFRLAELYRRDRDAVLSTNGDFLYAGYGDLFVRHLLRRRDDPVHPALVAAPPVRLVEHPS